MSLRHPRAVKLSATVNRVVLGVRAARDQEREQSQEGFARDVGVTLSTVSRWTRGHPTAWPGFRRTWPTSVVLKRIGMLSRCPCGQHAPAFQDAVPRKQNVLVRQCSRMLPEAPQIQRGIRRQHWGPARDVQPTTLTLRLRVDHVFAVLYWSAATACRTLARRERRFRPLDHLANVLSTSKFERHLLPPHGRPRGGHRDWSDSWARRTSRRLVDFGRPSGLLPEGDAVGGGQLPRFVVIDVRSRSCVHEQSLDRWAGRAFVWPFGVLGVPP